MINFPIPRLDIHPNIRELLLPFCRLRPGEIWFDPIGKHRVGCLDAADRNHITALFHFDQNIESIAEKGSTIPGEQKPALLAIHDPPYNVAAFTEQHVADYIEWCSGWIDKCTEQLDTNSSLYVWLGADQNNGFQPLPDFMLMMRDKPEFKARSFITMRNQRGYGTQKNWMAVRQELLFYQKGEPFFNVQAEYTDIPKILRGYYKDINNKNTENMERSKSHCIRAGNVWVDVQQVFYRMEENVNGCFAQKPLSSIQRIINASSKPEDLVLDFFAHAGTTLLACEIGNRCCYTIDIDPLYAEISIRRLEHYRKCGKTGWQNSNPFHQDLHSIGIGGFSQKGEPIPKDNRDSIDLFFDFNL